MRRAAFLLPLLATAASSSAQAPWQQSYRPTFQPAPAVNNDINWAIADWRRLRQSSGYSFGDYARFLVANSAWPGESTLRRNAERAIRPGENPATVLAFFASAQPTTGNGHAALADALLANGRQAEALAAAREAWASGDLSTTYEPVLHARYGAHFTRSDHDRRVDALLFDKKVSDAHRLLGFVSPHRAASFGARIAMQSRMPDAERRYQPLMANVTSDAGLMMDRARYLRDTGLEHAARQLFARPRNLVHRPTDPGRFYEMMLLLARGAASDRQWRIAYDIARQVDDVFPAGTDISLKPLGIRDDYTSLTWLAGTAALDGLGRPAEAVTHFHRYSQGGRSLQVASKGLYWAGRAALAAGRASDAGLYFQSAARYPELFYGQLALERVGRSVTAPRAINPVVNDAQRVVFSGNRLVRATRLLGQLGRRDEQTLFIRALAESLQNDAERSLALEFGQQIGRQDVSVWVSRSARNKGASFYARQAYPTLASAPRGHLWPLTHGIARQESSFDRAAISHAGARGMMQLMLPTAREQAGKMGVAYNSSRLTSDPAYNVMLGSAYFARLLNNWNGNVPLAVASYNAGSGNVRKWVRANGDPRNTDVIRWIEAIPFMETRGYVQRVIENSVVYDSMNPQPAPRSAMHVSRYLGKSRPG
ncbi:lytic transglycosylase domain-containing protein [Sphingomonas sp.]|uniref:lytic transglycosylase domain-containing protein n=1 Tax=Sphingomonas sp. TaxID=28214 RepID=UPI0017F115CC|nr:lytic transglycosylase domain-containing protein [Sphingomonas sp.]MBA3511321.1 lytic transglycosylase domain-containing protein [Sphingomonas sp.]